MGDPSTLRSDAQSNRSRILAAAVAELTVSADASMSSIAKRAGVGQGTIYRHFPDRNALVLEIYRHEMQQIADLAGTLLETRTPDRALREWMDHLAQYAIMKAGLADAVRQATAAPDSPGTPGHAPMLEAADRLLRAGEADGSIRPGVTADDFFLAVAGLWQLDSQTEWKPRLTWLLDLVMAGLRADAQD